MIKKVPGQTDTGEIFIVRKKGKPVTILIGDTEVFDHAHQAGQQISTRKSSNFFSQQQETTA